MGASHTQRCGPEARAPRMSQYTGWRPARLGTQWARYAPSDAGRRPARPGWPMIRAGGLRAREPDGRHVPSDAGRRPARPGWPMIRAGGLRAQKPDGRVTHPAMRAGGPRTQDGP